MRLPELLGVGQLAVPPTNLVGGWESLSFFLAFPKKRPSATPKKAPF